MTDKAKHTTQVELAEALRTIQNEGVAEAFNPDARMAALSAMNAAEKVWKMVPAIIDALEARIPQEDELREALKDARRYIANCWIDPVATEEERALVAKIDAALEGRSGDVG